MLKLVDPATGQLLTELPVASAADVEQACRRARAAQPAWAARPLAERIALLRGFRDRVAQELEPLAQTLTSEVGKPITQSRNELRALAGRLDFFLGHTASTLAPETVLDDAGLQERIVHEPLGLVANISAWNYPWFVGSNVFVPALLAGNAVLYKPSEHASLTGLAIARLLHDSGVPADVFVPLVGAGPVGAELVLQPVDGVYFTGSYATGKRIAEAVAGRLVRLQLELGGKDPVYVCPDADVARAAASLADGAFYNTGQSCCAVERIYVHRAVYPAFLDAFLAEVRNFVVGDPRDERTYIGPVAREPQLAVLEQQCLDAKARGARLLHGGKRLDRPGFYFEPTVFADTDHSMLLMREESFGPIIGLQPVEDDARALELMNDTPYGLTAGVYTPDRARAERILAQVRSGSVYWNCCDRVSPRLPWSGRGHSGIGLTLSRHGILAFTQPKAWHLRQP